MKNTNILLKSALFLAIIILFGSLARVSRAATYMVDTTVDTVALNACTAAANDCSLRGAITKANSTSADDTIDFAIPAGDAGCTAGGVCTITLLNGELTANVTSTSGKLTISNATGTSKLLISGNNASRVFTVSANGTQKGDLTLNGLTVTNGRVLAVGGGISNNGRLALINSVVTGNTAQASDGGGIYNFFEATITNSTISNNSGGNGGGIFNASGANLTITNSTISGNTAGNGGGIADVQTGATVFSNGSFDIRNSTISGNTANSGGGIYSSRPFGSIFGPKPTLLGVTITGNSSTAPDSNGGGASFINALDGTVNDVNLRNTIIAGNNNVNAPDIYGILDANSDYNLIGNGTGLTNNSVGATGNQIGTSANPINPQLAPLADNGGPTKTHALLTGSPAMDKGNSFGLTTDQRGLLRPLDIASISNASGGDGADIGAFEASSPTAASVSIRGRVTSGKRNGIPRATIYLTDQNGEIRTARTDSTGFYRFENIMVGQTYALNVFSKNYVFDSKVITVNEEVSDFNFSALP